MKSGLIPIVGVTMAATLSAPFGTRAEASSGVVYDNGGPNGVNGYANGTPRAFDGPRRTLLDDFEVPSPCQGWRVDGFQQFLVWGIPDAFGESMDLVIRHEVFGMVGPIVRELSITSYHEEYVGQFFSREGYQTFTAFDEISLVPGRYWIEAAVVGPQFNFWLTADVRGEECQVNYDDLGGFRSGIMQFGAPSDIAWSLSGSTDCSVGSCCLPDDTCVGGRTRAQCDAIGGCYQVGDCEAGVDCAPIACAPLKACCFADGTCADVESGDTCAATGGFYLGADRTCATTQCAPFGACCLPDGTCMPGVMSPECYAFRAHFQIAGTCDECPYVCPGDFNFGGSVEINDLLRLLEAWGPCHFCQFDVDRDERVGFSDLLVVLAGWGRCP